MSISQEGKIGIGLSLLLALGAGAYMRFPDQLWIGSATMAVAGVGLIALAVHHFQIKPSRRSVGISAAVALAIIGLSGWYFWPCPTTSKIAAETTPAMQEPIKNAPPLNSGDKLSEQKLEANISLELAVDTVSGDDIGFHLVTANVSTSIINISRIGYSASSLMDVEMDETASGPRRLAPGSKVSFRGSKPNGILKNRLLDVSVQYESDNITYTSVYKFMLPDGNLVGKNIDPSSLDRSIGTIESVTGFSGNAMIIKRLSVESGAIIRTLPEMRPDNTQNISEIYASGKYFLFDPVNRNVLFSIHFPSGDIKSRKTLLLRNDSATHKVGISWDNRLKNISMFVDGKAASAQ